MGSPENVLERRISTGNAQMDEVLCGGFPVNSLNIIMGQPGTGKTIFAEQMVFHHAVDDDRPILYLTTLSEPVSKVLTYLQRFSFFDEDKIGTVALYQDIGPKLAQSGVSALVPYIVEAIHSSSPKMIVIDSFKALHDLAETAQEMRRMLHELTSTLAAYETTVFLLGEYTDENARVLPEFAIADGIVQFLRNPQSTRDERFMRVLKLRGSKYLEGLHGCRITSAGLDIYPRLVTPDFPQSYEVHSGRISTGVPGLDDIMGGGVRRGSTTLVAGPTGSGKTTVCLQYALDGLKQKERSLFVNFQENPTQLGYLFSSMGIDPNQAQEQGLELLYTSPVELQIDSIIVKLFNIVSSKKIDRVVVDAIGDLGRASNDQERLHGYLYSLIQHFTVRGVTSYFTYETMGQLTETGSALSLTQLSNISDNILLLELGTEPDFERTARCMKARGSKHDLKPHRFEMSDKGISFLN